MNSARQSRLESIVEKVIDLLSGIVLAYFAWLYLVPAIWPQYESPPGTALSITLLFTAISFFRGYFWRRFFNNRVHLLVHRALKQRWLEWTWRS